MDSFTINVIAYEYWKPGQCIVKITQNEFDNFIMNKRRRLLKRKPEYWVFINVKSIEDFSKDQCEIYISRSKHGDEIYSTSPEIVDNEPEPYRCDSHLFRCSPELKIIFCEKCGKTKSV
jgi:hypothetical protein